MGGRSTWNRAVDGRRPASSPRLELLLLLLQQFNSRATAAAEGGPCLLAFQDFQWISLQFSAWRGLEFSE